MPPKKRELPPALKIRAIATKQAYRRFRQEGKPVTVPPSQELKQLINDIISLSNK